MSHEGVNKGAAGAKKTGPLAGFKVVEVATYAAGPSAGAILCDWGAEVLKVEPPGGDPFRLLANAAGAPAGAEYTSSDQDNRGKKSVAIDLGSPQGRAIVGELIARADVFLTNMRLPALRKLRLDDETLRGAHPRLVYALLTGYGVSGPDIELPAFDAGTFFLI
jgi:crotonobetainyl-CoA:carnitine CoA-transferase CaiB-like acyl-CoA transferase